MNDVFAKVAEGSGANRITGRPYHPQSQGVVERKNRTIIQKLVKVAEKNPYNWASEVPRIVLNGNNQVAPSPVGVLRLMLLR